MRHALQYDCSVYKLFQAPFTRTIQIKYMNTNITVGFSFALQESIVLLLSTGKNYQKFATQKTLKTILGICADKNVF